MFITLHSLELNWDEKCKTSANWESNRTSHSSPTMYISYGVNSTPEMKEIVGIKHKHINMNYSLLLERWALKSGMLFSSVDFTSWIREEIELKTVPFFMELCRHYWEGKSLKILIRVQWIRYGKHLMSTWKKGSGWILENENAFVIRKTHFNYTYRS